MNQQDNPKAIMSDLEILRRMCEPGETRLVITPVINFNVQLNPTSLDVRLGTEFILFQHQRFTHLDLLQPLNVLRQEVFNYGQTIEIRIDPKYGGLVLHPGEFALGSTLEYVSMPYDIAAKLEGRSSWGRLGLQIHSTAGFVDPGFRGNVTFELSNLGKLPIPLYAGLRVAQLSFYRCIQSPKPYGMKPYSKYQHQFGTRVTSLFEDPEFEDLRQLRAKHVQEERLEEVTKDPQGFKQFIKEAFCRLGWDEEISKELV